MKSDRLRIYIPEKSEAAVLTSLKKYLGSKGDWEKVIKDVEASSQETIDAFVNKLLSRTYKREVYKLIESEIYTVLTQGLFDQFSHEKNIYYCAEFLRDAVIFADKISWSQIDQKDFNARIKKAWGAFPRLVWRNKWLDTNLLRCLGLSINDFTKSFFSGDNVEDVTNALETPAAGGFNSCPAEIKATIFSYVYVHDLYSLRKASRSTYLIVESNVELRMEHRLHLLGTNAGVLRQWIGKCIYHGNDYLLVEPSYNLISRIYHVISMKNPYECLQYVCSQHINANCEVIGGYVFVDAEEKLNILTAHHSLVNNNLFFLQGVKVDKNDTLMNSSTAKVIKVMHEETSVENNGDFRWHKTAKIKVESDNVVIDARFARLHRWHNHYVEGLFTRIVCHSAQCALADFDSDVKEIVAVKNPS